MVKPKAYAPPVNVARTREKLKSNSNVTIISIPPLLIFLHNEDFNSAIIKSNNMYIQIPI